MPAKRHPCVDCSKPSLGERCVACDRALRKAKAAAAIRTCACQEDAATCSHAPGACRNGLSVRNETGICLSCIRKTGVLRVRNKVPAPEPRLPPKADLSVSQDDDVLRISSCRPGIDTVEDAIRECSVDLNVWKIHRHSVKAYQSPNRDGSRQMVAISLELRRRVNETLCNAMERFVTSCDIPRAPAVRSKRKAVDVLGVYSPTDAHFGALCWASETGDDYDTGIASERYLAAAHDATTRAKALGVGGFLHPVGSDFFHFDTLAGTTTGGTPLDVDSRPAKVYEAGLAAAIGAVYELLEVGPVRIIHSRGNHDAITSMWLVMAMREHFRADKRVSVDLDPAKRKYASFGKSLLGFAHGDKIKADKLPLVMAQERPKDWAATTYHDWYIGHYHHRQRVQWIGSTEVSGCVVRQLPSMAGTDAWHSEQGFVGNHKCAEVHVYDVEAGHVAALTVGARDAAA